MVETNPQNCLLSMLAQGPIELDKVEPVIGVIFLAMIARNFILAHMLNKFLELVAVSPFPISLHPPTRSH